MSFPRIFCKVRSVACKRSVPRKIAPPRKRAFGALVSPMSVMHVTDLPDPDSPTRQRTSPESTKKLTSSTARTTPSSVT